MTVTFAEYVRVSGQNQADRQNQEVQRQALLRLRERRPGALVPGGGPTGAHEDLAISGALGEGDRPGWAAICELIRARAIDELRIVAIDRLTRSDSVSDLGNFVDRFVGSETVIVEADGTIIDVRGKSGMEPLMLLMRAMGAGDERRRIIKRFLDGRRAGAQSGAKMKGAWGGDPPFGYRFVRGEGYVPDWTDIGGGWTPAGVVQRAFQLLHRHSMAVVCKMLDAEGAPPPRGGSWVPVTLGKWTKQTVYKGEFTGHLPPDLDDRKRPFPPPPGVEAVFDKAGAPHWRYSLNIEPIIDPADWEAVRASVDCRRNKRKEDFHEVCALFRYYLVCGVCGRPMSAENTKVRGTRYPRYRCSLKSCTHRTGYTFEPIDAAAWGAIVDAVCAPGGLAAAAAAGPDASTANAEVNVLDAEKRVNNLRLEIKELLKTFSKAHAEVRRGVEEHLEVLGKQVSHWEGVIREQRAFEAQRAEIAARIARAADQIAALKSALARSLDFPQRRELVELLFGGGAGRVSVHPAKEGRGVKLEIMSNLLAASRSSLVPGGSGGAAKVLGVATTATSGSGPGTGTTLLTLRGR